MVERARPSAGGVVYRPLRRRHDLVSPRRRSAAIFASSSSITSGSRRVVTSPSARPSAMSRSSRRMILPERVFGRSSAQMIRFGRANLPIRSATVGADALDQLVAGLGVAAQGDEGADRLAGVLVGLADHRRLGDLLVGDDRRLDLGGREPVAGDVDDVVDPADHPEVAVARRGGRRRRPGSAPCRSGRSRSRRSGRPPCRGRAASRARGAPGPAGPGPRRPARRRSRRPPAPRPRGTASSPSPAWSR